MADNARNGDTWNYSVGFGSRFTSQAIDDTFRNLFPELVEKHEEIMQERIRLLGEGRVQKERDEYKGIMNSRDSSGERGDLQGLMALLAGIFAVVIFIFMRFL